MVDYSASHSKASCVKNHLINQTGSTVVFFSEICFTKNDSQIENCGSLIISDFATGTCGSFLRVISASSMWNYLSEDDRRVTVESDPRAGHSGAAQIFFALNVPDQKFNGLK